MTTAAEGTELTRVGPGTVMGELMRQYWIPAAMSSELIADGAPVRLLLLGEKLIGFRDSAGRVGVMDHRCPHRCAPLFLGRNDFQVGWEIVKAPGEAMRYMDLPSRDGRGSLNDAGNKVLNHQLDVHFTSGVYNHAFFLLAHKPGWNTNVKGKPLLYSDGQYAKLASLTLGEPLPEGLDYWGF